MAEIASAFVSIVPSMQGFGGQLRAGVGASTTSVGKGAGAAFGKVFAAAAAIGIGSLVGGYLKGAVEQASDLNEAGTKIEAIFGKGATAVQEFAGRGAQALGQTRLEVLNASAQFGTFGKAAGLAGNDLATFSTDFTTLATDLASFNNTTPEEAVQAIGAALRGEAEPIRQFGVLLDDATLRNEALKLGLISTTSEALTPQQKVLAAQAAIYKQTADAQGDFERTSGGLANQQRILSASLTDIQAKIGEALLPVATQFFTYLNTTALPVMSALGTYISTNFGPAFEKVRAAVARFFNGSSGDVGAWATNIKSIIRDAVTIATKLWDTFGKDIIRYATAAFRNVQQIIGGGLNVIAGIFKTISAVMRGDWSAAWDGIKQIVRGAADVVVGLVRQLANVVQLVLSAGWKALKGIATAAWDGVKAAVQTGVNTTIGVVKQLPGKAAAALGDLGSYLYAKGQALIQGLINGILSKVAAVGDALSSVAGKIKGYLPGSPVKEGPLKSWNNGGAGKRLMDLLADGITKGEAKVAESMQKALGKAVDAAQAQADRMKSVVDSIRSAMDSLADSVTSAFSGDLFNVDAAGDFFKGALAQASQLRDLRQAFKTLRGYGLSSGFLAQLFASGNSALIFDLAEGGKSDARFAEVAYQQTQKLSRSLGGDVSEFRYGRKLDRQTDILKAILKELGFGKTLAKDLAKAINQAASDGQRKRKAAAA